MTEFPDIIRSPLSQTFSHDGITVRVEIYKIEGTDGWTLELHTYTETAEFLDEADRERRHRDEAERARRLDRAHGRG